MKVLFICGSLAPGRDGVGDYTRKLAIELCNYGYQIKLVAIKDKFADMVIDVDVNQSFSGASISELRLPANISSQERKNIISQVFKEFSPNWVSIQYVGYSFQKRAMPFKLVNELKELKIEAKVHIMFHEIWLGEANENTLKDKFVGVFQKRAATMLVNGLNAVRVSTSNAYYQRCLSNAGISANTIPVFSNIPVGSAIGCKVCDKLPSNYLAKPNQYILACFFGGFHNHIHVTARLKKLAADINMNFGKELLVTHIGNSRGINEIFARLKEDTGIAMVALGQYHENDIADFLQRCDIGLSNHPKILYEKSGSTAAMLYNKCPVVIIRDGFEKDDRRIKEIEEYTSITDIKSFINQPNSFFKHYGVTEAARKYNSIFTDV